VKNVNHIGIAVRSLKDTLTTFSELFGLKADKVMELEQFDVKAAFIPLGETSLELIQPASPNSDAERFLKERGEGLHHICFEVEDIKGAIEELKRNKIELLSEKPLEGVGGTIIFIHPDHANNVLIELMEKTR
jgi:methylmalonyl-CoA epimerase